MSVRRLYDKQPDSFAFTPENMDWAATQIAKYPEGRQASAVLPLLWQAQKQGGGWLSEPAIRCVADMLDMPYMRALEVATFIPCSTCRRWGNILFNCAAPRRAGYAGRMI